MPKDHMEGFEKEVYFNEALKQASLECPSLKFKTMKKIAAQFAPEFANGLFEPRPCKRKLMYIGHRDFVLSESEKIEQENDSPFSMGQIYDSEDFNGATYTIKGMGDNRVGLAYFDWID